MVTREESEEECRRRGPGCAPRRSARPGFPRGARGARAPGFTWRLRLRGRRAGHSGRARHRGSAAPHRPLGHRQDLPPQHALRGARPRAPPLQREPHLLRRPGRLSLSRQGRAGRALPRDAGHGVGRGVGAHRRDQPLQARAPEPALLHRSRAQGAGAAALSPPLPLGGHESVHRRPGGAGGLHRLRAARPGPRRPLRAHRRGERLGGAHRGRAPEDRRAGGRGAPRRRWRAAAHRGGALARGVRPAALAGRRAGARLCHRRGDRAQRRVGAESRRGGRGCWRGACSPSRS